MIRTCDLRPQMNFLKSNKCPTNVCDTCESEKIIKSPRKKVKDLNTATPLDLFNDGGGEFNQKGVIKYYDANGYSYQFNAPKTLKQLGLFFLLLVIFSFLIWFLYLKITLVLK